MKARFSRSEIDDQLKGELIVSCQAYPGEPLDFPTVMAKMAIAARLGGARGVRAQGVADIAAIRRAVDIPIIGLWKTSHEGVFITPTAKHAIAVAYAGADIVALDGTRRPRPDGLSLAVTVERLRNETDSLVMADIGSVQDAIEAQAAGVDYLATTLAGYTEERTEKAGPDLELIQELRETVDTPIIAEGRFHTPDQAAEAIRLGAFAVVVGTAITHPTSITSWFSAAVAGSHGTAGDHIAD